MKYRNLTSFVIAALSLLSSSYLFAKNINLYDQPKTDAKVIGSIDSSTGIVPIFTPKDSTWMKVGDPKNGNVGWIKSSELSDSKNGFTFTQHIISTGQGPGSYQIIQFGTPNPPVSSEKAQAMLKEMEARQQAIQKETQKLMQDMFNSPVMNFPMIMPVIVVPEKTESPKKTTPPVTEKKSS